MSRVFTAAVLATLLFFTSIGPASASIAPGVVRVVTVSGTLELVTDMAIPHYEVGGYVLITKDTMTLSALGGQEVTVTGTEVQTPSIFMRKALQVIDISARPDTDTSGDDVVSLPVIPAPVPPVADEGDQWVTTPVLPSPEPLLPPPTVDTPVTTPVLPGPSPEFPPPSETPVTIPAPPPTPFFGTPFYALFGQVEVTDGKYYLVQEMSLGTIRTPIYGVTVKLADFVGQKIGAVAALQTLPDGKSQYLVLAAVILTGDFAERIQLGTGVLYLPSALPIFVKFRGQNLKMDQAPIIGNSRTMVGLRAVAEALGATVSWDQATQTVTITVGARQVIVQVASNRVVVREPNKPDVVIFTDITPVLVGGRVMVPLRVIAEALGLKVGWDALTRTVTID